MRKLLTVSFSLTFLILFSGALAAAPDQGQSPEPLTVYTKDTAARAPDGRATKLLERARQIGRLRLIVGLNFQMRVSQRVSASEEQAQQAALATMQNAVAARVFGRANAQAEGRFWFIPFMALSAGPAEIEKLLSDPDVAVIEEDRASSFTLQDSINQIRAPAAWNRGYRGAGQAVAIIDTGVDKTHPMLTGKVVSEACYSTTDAARNLKSTCPKGVSASTAANSGVNCRFSRPSTCFHGTHVAGIATGNSSLRGVAPDAKIIAINVATQDTTSISPVKLTIRDEDVLKALQRVYALRRTYKIAAVNLSFGSGAFRHDCDIYFPSLASAVNGLRAAGIAVVASTGNDGKLYYLNQPACLSGVIPVAATTKSSQLASYATNYSEHVKFLAPGIDITSAVPGGGVLNVTGTSQAAPHVAGAYALMRNVDPTATLDETTAALTCSGKTINSQIATKDAAPTHLALTGTQINMLGAVEFLRNTAYTDLRYTFDNGLHLRDWTPVRGEWTIRTGTYAPTARSRSGWVVSKTSLCAARTDISATITRNRPDDPYHKYSGIFVRASGAYGLGMVSGYFVGFTDCPTDLRGVCTGNPLDPKGQVVVWRYHRLFLGSTPGVTSTAGFGTLRLCQKRATMVSPKGANVVRVVSDGANHKVYINGALVCDVTDLDFLTGDLLLAANMDIPYWGDKVSYDNVVIRKLPAAGSVADQPAILDPAALGPAQSPVFARP